MRARWGVLVALVVVAAFAVLLIVGLRHSYNEGKKQSDDRVACLMQAEPTNCDR